MRDYTTDQLALMPEARAVSAYFAIRNYGVLVWTWPIAVMTYFGFFIHTAVEGRVLALALASAGLALLMGMFLLRKHESFEANFELIFLGFMVLVPAGLVLVAEDSDFRMIFPGAIAPMFLLFMRLRPRFIIPIALIYAGMSLAVSFADNRGEDMGVPIITNLMFAGTSMFITRRRRIAFLKEWVHTSRREAERERMREELADARKIQLAMLPESPPSISWLDISSVSIPATEVGGDFYEYFELDDDRVVIAIGDVAGHGVGSGLVLAGIKSGLHLLREELNEPVEAVRRLNRVASEWLQWRMLVTLLIAVVDRPEKKIRVVCAGHPPLLIARGDECISVGSPALPLGTRLAPTFKEDLIDLRDGDTLLCYTDGVTEQQNPDGEMYEDERLEAVLRDASSKYDSAREIRDPILSDISYFKDKAPQLDDLSFVVARVGDL